jgi:DNA-directed RNA polymerase specialized sigma24 family protein
VVYTTALDLLEKRWIQLPPENVLAGSESGRATAEFAVESDIDRALLRRDLERELEGISRMRRVVLKLRLAGMDIEEMAARLNWTPNKVRHLYYRGLADLRKKFHRRRTDRDAADQGGDHERSEDALSEPGRIRKILPE